MSAARGRADVESERGVIRVKAEFRDFEPPSSFGPEYLTYVLWAISPDGRPVNMGEITLNDYGKGSSSKIETTSEIQTFAMIVTAEPYYAVTQPSDVVVLENQVRPDTQGVIEQLNAKFELLPRGIYTSAGRERYVPVRVGKKNPFELYEAENAVQLASLAGAAQYAPDSFQKATETLKNAENYQVGKPGQKMVITMAREAVLRAEDARVIALRRQRDEAALARENAEKAKAETARLQAEEEARRRTLAENDRAAADAQRVAAEQARRDAEAQRLAAEQATIEATRQKREAEAAQQAALAQQQQLAAEVERSRSAADLAERQRREAEQAAQQQRQQAEEERLKLRQQLLAQLNVIMQTRDTARGLIVNMSDVLFDTGRFTLTPGAREKLAKVSGIILSHPGLTVKVEGHTDSVGSDEYNMKLSENRANSVRTFLVGQGIESGSVTAQGFGKTMPVADNSTAAGRQRNRRVELVVSGELLGTVGGGGIQ